MLPDFVFPVNKDYQIVCHWTELIFSNIFVILLPFTNVVTYLLTYFLTYLLFETFGSFPGVVAALCWLQYIGTYNTDAFPSRGLRNFLIDCVLAFDTNGG